MKILPILFNTEMVRAILDGRKTTTRRLIRPRYKEDESGFKIMTNMGTGERWVEKVDEEEMSFDPPRYINPPYQPGDILYVRETWQYLYELDGNEQIIEGTGKYYYAATDSLPSGGYVDSKGSTYEIIPWKPSIHMPKAAARIWLKVTDVRVERLQDMDKTDAAKEGIDPWRCLNLVHMLAKFAKIWDSTIKKSDCDIYGWKANPWVWVIEFERCEKPEEQKVREKYAGYK